MIQSHISLKLVKVYSLSLEKTIFTLYRKKAFQLSKFMLSYFDSNFTKQKEDARNRMGNSSETHSLTQQISPSHFFVRWEDKFERFSASTFKIGFKLFALLLAIAIESKWRIKQDLVFLKFRSILIMTDIVFDNSQKSIKLYLYFVDNDIQ